MRLMSSANDLFEWIVTSSQLNDVFVIRTVILHRSFHSLLWSIRSTLILLWSCQCPKGNPQNTRRRSPKSHPADQRFSTTTTSKTPGSSPFSASPRKQVRQTPNFRMYATVAPPWLPPERPAVTAIGDSESRLSGHWQGEPQRRCNAPRYDEKRHDIDPDSCRALRSVSWQVPL